VVDQTPHDAEVLSGDLVVDREACMGSGNCVYWSPDVFQLDDDGVAAVIGDVAGNEERVRSAMMNCPTSAIRFTDN
jgi:ferredoxin